jgi:hypothetical protein
MTYHVLYRKPKFHKGWPWNDYFLTAKDVTQFMGRFGDDYEFRIFEEISVSDIDDMAEAQEQGGEV